MKIHRESESFTELERKQMLKIDELQEKIKLLEFDRIKDNEKIAELKRKINNRNEAISNAIKSIQLFDIKLAVKNLKNVLLEDKNE